MQFTFIQFGEIEIDGTRYTQDVVVVDGALHQRDKDPSRPYKKRFGHTPLAVEEVIPWDCARLVVGTGVHGKLPIMDAVYAEAEARGVELVAVTTPEACRLLSEGDLRTTNAILHLTC
ncbi:MAG: hypothetical protein GYB65_15905 [Chloroflexi bacterium]|nr:hypothetical protein [Chloroflexota bacterium]